MVTFREDVALKRVEVGRRWIDSGAAGEHITGPSLARARFKGPRESEQCIHTILCFCKMFERKTLNCDCLRLMAHSCPNSLVTLPLLLAALREVIGIQGIYLK